MAELQFHAVHKCFGNAPPALLGVDFKAPPGRLTAILGPSGSGKSTLLRIAAGLEAPTSGRVTLDGRDLRTVVPGARPIAYLAQGEQLFPHLNVIDNVAFGLRAIGLSVAEIRHRARTTLEMLGLVGCEASAPHELSGGQAQRVALARALVLDPDAILLDEPLAGLDQGLKRRVREEIRALQQLLGVTMVVVTHDQAEAMSIADHIALLCEGRLVQQGTPRALYANPDSEYAAASLGDVEALTGWLSADGHLRVGPLLLQGVPGALASPGARRVRLMVRPEAWSLAAVGLAPETGFMPGRIARSTYLGRLAEYHVECELGVVFVRVPAGEALHAVGAPVDLLLDVRAVRLARD